MLESRPAERPGIWDRDIETTPTAWKEAGVGMVVTYLTPLNPVPAPLVEETSIEPTAAVSAQARAHRRTWAARHQGVVEPRRHEPPEWRSGALELQCGASQKVYGGNLALFSGEFGVHIHLN